MLTAIGDFLNWIAAGFLFPLMLLPVASLAGRTNRATALLWAALVVAVAGGCILFAALAVDIDPPRASFGLYAAFMAGLLLTGGAVAALGAGNIADRLARPAETIVRATGRLTLWLVLIMALVQFAAVILRYVFGLNYISMQESITYLHGAVFLLASGYALLTDDHVRVDIYYRDASSRKKALIDLVGAYIFLFPFCLVTLWAVAPYVANSWAVREGSTEQSGIQGVYLLKTLIPIFAVLLAMAGFVLATRAARALSDREA